MSLTARESKGRRRASTKMGNIFNYLKKCFIIKIFIKKPETFRKVMYFKKEMPCPLGYNNSNSQIFESICREVRL